MRWLGRLSAALCIALFLFAALFYGANFYLRDSAEQVGATLERYLPGVTVRFSDANFRLGFGGVAFRTHDLFIGTENGNYVSAPRADLWIDAVGITTVLHSPEIVWQQNDKDDGPILPLAGVWSIQAVNASGRVDVGDASITLQNFELRAKHDSGHLQADVAGTHDQAQLNLAADLQIDENGIAGLADVNLTDWNLPFAPEPWQTVSASLRLTIDHAGAGISAIGQWQSPIHLTWSADGRWNGKLATLSVTAQALQMKPAANAPPADVFANGLLSVSGNQWQWQGDMVAAGEDGKIGGSVFVASAKNINHPPEFQIDLRATDVPAASLNRYIAHDDTAQWFEQSVLEGVIHAAHLKASGTTDHPNIELTAAFANARIDIAEGWPDAEELQGTVSYRGNEVVIVGGGRIAGATADDIVTSINIDEIEPATLFLTANFNQDDLPTLLTAAGKIPPAAAEVRDIASQTRMSGGAQLSLDIAAPLANPQNTSFFARLSLPGNATVFAGQDLPPLEQLTGKVDIDADGARATLRGMFQNRPVIVQANNDDIRIRGRVSVIAALAAAGAPDFPASGTAEFVVHRTDTLTTFTSNLHGVQLDLPPPLQKSKSDTVNFSATSGPDGERLTLQTESDTVAVHLRGDGADVAINEPPQQPPLQGTHIHGAIAKVENAAAWLEQGGAGATELSVVIFNSFLLNMQHDILTIVSPLPDAQGARTIRLDGNAVSGEISFQPGGANADFSRLSLSDLSSNGTAPDIELLSVTVSARDFHVGGASLGTLFLRGAPASQDGWQLSTLRIYQDGYTLAAAGQYDGAQTALSLALDAPDAPSLLSSFGQDSVLSEGQARFAGEVLWSGAPPDFSANTLQGRLSLDAANMRYLKSDGGIISILAVLSPLSLLQLGFTEIGKEGVLLDTIQGEILLENGAAKFQDITMKNDDLSISLQGETNIATETLNISGRVRPGNRLLKAGAAVGAGIAAVQPLSLAAGWFLGKIFEAPLSEIGAYNYTITGDWQNPVYEESGITFKQLPPSPQ